MTYPFPKAIDLKNMSTKARASVNWGAGVVQQKYDGCAIVARRAAGQWVPVSGSGKPVYSLGAQMAALPDMPEGSVLVGEAWHPMRSFQEISGAFRSHSRSDLTIKWFDGFVNVPGMRESGYLVRCRAIDDAGVHLVGCLPGTSLAFVQYCAEEFASRRVYRGFDGAVWHASDAPFEEGRSRSHVIKVKPLVDFDVECIGYDVGTGEKTGRATVALICKWRDLGTQEVATGLSHDQQANPEQFVGRIIRVSGMGLTDSGKLREPRFGGISDKTVGDF